MKLEVVTGFLLDGEFYSYLNEYQDPDSELPDNVVATDEERQQYEDGDNEVCRAADGKLFFNFEKAKAYNDTLSIPELDEVLELLEKAKVICSTSSNKSPVLATIKDALSNIERDGGEALMNKYYDSTC